MLSDDQVAAMRDRAARGENHHALAADFGVTERHVRRIVRGQQRTTLRPTAGAVSIAVDELLAGMELDDSGDRVLAAAAMVLAGKLDSLAVSDAAAAAAAAPALVRQLGDTLRQLRGEEAAGDLALMVRRMLQPLVGS
jgi:predicted transcriptional regulator